MTELAIGPTDLEDMECPLCMEEIDITDKYFKPCPCGYQICRFCWNHIKEDLNGLCPACRRPYSDETVVFKPVPTEELNRIKLAKKKKEREKKETDLANRKHLANVRVIQKNLVYVLGLPNRLASEEVLKSQDYFGQYGKIIKIVINRKPPPGANPNAHSHTGVYITYARKEDAAKAIEAVDGSVCDNRMIRATFGTTKYCSFFLKNQTCLNSGCQFLHEHGEDADSFTKDELIPQAKVTPKPPPFPVGGAAALKGDDKEDNAIPMSSAWTKPNVKEDVKSKIPAMVKKPTAAATPTLPKSNLLMPSEVQIGLVMPLSFITSKADPMILQLSNSAFQPKYSGPFDPFRQMALKPIANSKMNPIISNLTGADSSMEKQLQNYEHASTGMNDSRQDAQLAYDAFRNVLPNVNVTYQRPGQPAGFANALPSVGFTKPETNSNAF